MLYFAISDELDVSDLFSHRIDQAWLSLVLKKLKKSRCIGLVLTPIKKLKFSHAPNLVCSMQTKGRGVCESFYF